MGEPFVPDRRQPPQPDALGFDHRLLSPERLLELAGKWTMRYCNVDGEFISLDCARCGKAIEILVSRNGNPYIVTAGQLLSNVLRHQVMRHDLSLSGANGG